MRTKRFSEAVAMTSLLPSTGQFQKPLSGISMFDCPDANHTSPMSTRLRTTFSPPCSSMTMVCSSFEAAGVAMLSSHWPSLSARVVNLSPVQSTVMVMSHFGAACPQRCACVFCCRTMSSPMMSGSTIFACTGLRLMARSAQTAPMNFVIVFIFYSYFPNIPNYPNHPNYPSSRFNLYTITFVFRYFSRKAVGLQPFRFLNRRLKLLSVLNPQV